MKGTVFDIQRFSVHDGPGIRTTVFMKGCPLRCRWCHNPEGLSGELQLQFFEDKCISCGACGDRSGISCAERCPAEALTVCGRVMTADQVVDVVVRDGIFYGENGGVTFSGGECLLQADFVVSVMEKVKKRGFTAVIDTSGCVSWPEIEKTVELCDLYLYDVKCLDSEKHRAFTGVDNVLILENLKRLSALGKEIWIRVPVIPQFNDSVPEMERIAEFLSRIGTVSQVTLMPYHTLGASKYKTLGMEYGFDTALKVNDGQMENFKRIFEERNIKTV